MRIRCCVSCLPWPWVLARECQSLCEIQDNPKDLSVWIFLVVGPVLFLSLMLLNLCIPIHRDWSSIPPTIVGIRMIRKQPPTAGLSPEQKCRSWWLPSPARRPTLYLSFVSGRLTSMVWFIHALGALCLVGFNQREATGEFRNSSRHARQGCSFLCPFVGPSVVPAPLQRVSAAGGWSVSAVTALGRAATRCPLLLSALPRPLQLGC